MLFRSVTGVRFLSPERFVTCSLDRTVRLWDPDLQEITRFRGPSAFTRITGERDEVYVGDWAGRVWPLRLRSPE